MSRKRRLSLDLETAEAVENINATMERLHQIWETIAMDEQSRVKRVRSAYGHLKQLLSDMVDAEEELASNIMADIKKNTETLQRLRSEMEMKRFPIEDYEENSIALWKALDAALTETKKEGDARIEKESLLKEQLTEFARKLEDASLLGGIRLSSSQSKVPTTSELEFLESQLASLQTIFNSRLSELLELQTDLIRETKQMNYQALNKELRQFMESNLADVDVIPSTKVAELRQWSSTIKEEYVRWAEDAQFRYLELYSQIRELWDKCYVSETERYFPEQFDPEVHTNEDVEALEAEVKRLDKCLEERRAIYANVNKWKALWQEKCEFEEKSSVDRNFYNNRGGQLQVILKRQQEVDRLLPRVQREMENALNTYRLTHSGEEVLIDGVSPIEYIERTVEQHRQEKDRRRMEKIAAKRHGDTVEPSPAKRKNLAGSVPSTPRKNVTPMAPRSEATQGSSHDISLGLSVISPVNTRPIIGPKASSPIETSSSGSVQSLTTPKRAPLRNTNDRPPLP